MANRGFLGIDAGTQGLSVVLTDENLDVIATGDGGYDMCDGLDEGSYEQQPQDWINALVTAMKDLRSKIDADLEVQGIGISGQMHGEVLVGKDNLPLKAARLWCDARNDAEGQELTQALGVKMPKRITSARWLWTIRNHPDLVDQVAHITTPGGWLAYYLTGQWNLGVGDAAGMFPIDQTTMDYDSALLEKFDGISKQPAGSLKKLLPAVRVAGDEGGSLQASAAAALGLPAGIPVSPAEGDQPASLAGSLIAKPGMVSVSFGTSVCANSVGDKPFQGVDDIVDHFCAPDGKPINMVCLRNGTTYMNAVVEMFGQAMTDAGNAFSKIMPQVVNAPADCDGLMALPFMDDEPGLGVLRGGQAALIGINANNGTPANAVKAALMSTIFNLKLGCQSLDQQGFPRTEIILTGGLTKTPALGQILADIMETPVVLLDGSDEGCAWGAALLAKFRVEKIASGSQSWESFLSERPAVAPTRFEPIADNVQIYQNVYQNYLTLVRRTVTREFAE